ncbi:MAG: DUF1016 family protein [Chitinophagaceae bacterium]|nr:MAG: DUF1016 family protein [Chitinophagaceae bacterium]
MHKVYTNLYEELSNLIKETRSQTYIHVNASLTMLFWKIGSHINKTVVVNKRAEYGKQIILTLSRELKQEFGRSFEEKNVRRMMQFADQFTDDHIVVTMSRQLSWSHLILLLPLKSIEAKTFYAEKVAQDQLSVSKLRKRIASKEFERREIANLQNSDWDSGMQNKFKDPYILDFLGLKDSHMEKDLENAILGDLETFLLELGTGFAFIERQKRMIIDGQDFYLDLLFFHRHLNRLVEIELKIGRFEARHKGQMELYLKWLEKYERNAGELTPVGLILCAESSREQVELLEMQKDGIIVAEYWTELPPKKKLEQKIHTLLEEARNRMQRVHSTRSSV